MSHNKTKTNFRQRWSEARPTKTIVFWSLIAAMALTMVIGFSWGGWVTGGTAQKMGVVMAQDAVFERLAPICVTQFNQDPERDQKLKELQETGGLYQRREYVQNQGWATMPGEQEPDRQVADECTRLLMLIASS